MVAFPRHRPDSYALAALAVATAVILAGAISHWFERGSFAVFGSEAIEPVAAILMLSAVAVTVSVAARGGLSRIGVRSTVAVMAASAILLGALPFLAAWQLGLAVATAGLAVGWLVARDAAPIRTRAGRTTLVIGLILCGGLMVDAALRARDDALDLASLGRPRIVGGVTAGSSLWLFDTAGRATSFTLPGFDAQTRASSGVHALAADGATVWALITSRQQRSQAEKSPGRFRLDRFSGDERRRGPTIAYAGGEHPLALAVGQDGMVVLSPSALHVTDPSGRLVRRALSIRLDRYGVASTLLIGRTLYAGFNQGEFGGGLIAIDVPTGRVVPIERRDRGELCQEPLDTGCSPVTGLARDGDRPGCLYASVGMAHFGWHGRVLRVCGRAVTEVFDHPIAPPYERIAGLFRTPRRRDTLPIFGLAAAPGGFYGATPRGIVRWNRGTVTWRSLPPLRPRRHIAMGMATRDLVVVRTDLNARHSLSGATPLLFAAR